MQIKGGSHKREEAVSGIIAHLCAIPHNRSMEINAYVSHIFIIMSNVWQVLLMAAWLLPPQCYTAAST
jgi:hypothetical protein